MGTDTAEALRDTLDEAFKKSAHLSERPVHRMQWVCGFVVGRGFDSDLGDAIVARLALEELGQ